jgi:fatty acid desaturase
LNSATNQQLNDGLTALQADDDVHLRRRSDVLGLLLILHAWLVIAACMLVFARWPNPLTFVVCSALIGGRQLGLSILMHDAAHRVLMRHAGLNDFAGHWLCGGAVGAHLYDYRPYHLSHHRHTQQDQDPDLVLSAPFPISASSLWRKVRRDMSGRTGIKQRVAQLRPTSGRGVIGVLRHEKAFVLCNLLLLSLLWAAGQPMLYVWLWLAPLLTWFQLFSRIRNIAEHAVTGDRHNRLRNTRTTFANLFERALVAPYWVNYHLEHHLYTFVPCWKLRQAHRLLINHGLGPQMELTPGYAAVLRKAVHTH